MKHFLIVYNRPTGELREFIEFGEDEADLASQARLERELAERTHPDIEVVVISSPSRAALKRTHGRYFMSLRELTATEL